MREVGRVKVSDKNTKTMYVDVVLMSLLLNLKKYLSAGFVFIETS